MSVQPSTRRFSSRPMASLSALATVREEFAGWLAEVTASEEKIEDLAVVISELGANAVRGTPGGRDAATVSAWLEEDDGDRTVVLEVANHVEKVTIPDADWDLEDPLRTGGRGLLLVSAFVDDVHVDVEGDLLIIRCTTAI
ncbi:MAG TPA: ATP-binding protein [Acidimicrobiales bacterium]|nr:ATP-binding protein [Acidimicrobiales bacterium]